MSETAELADVVLPAALWGEKTGCFTNVDRSVQLSLKAIEPPGEARSDLAIFLDYAVRTDFRDKDGAPLIKWSDAEGAFEAWKQCTRRSNLKLCAGHFFMGPATAASGSSAIFTISGCSRKRPRWPTKS